MMVLRLSDQIDALGRTVLQIASLKVITLGVSGEFLHAWAPLSELWLLLIVEVASKLHVFVVRF